ncbi:DUF2279 domain-containing protein [Kaarinaea lacus]
MKRLNPILIATLLLSLSITTLSGCATQQKNQGKDDWFAKDKYTHFLLSTAISAAIAKAAKENGQDNCDAALIGFSVTLTLGAAKESYDKHIKETFYSYRDMVWDAAGSALGSLVGSNCR